MSGAKPTHGGARKGAGRKPLPAGERKIQTTIRITADDRKFLQHINPNISEAVRMLIENQRI